MTIGWQQGFTDNTFAREKRSDCGSLTKRGKSQNSGCWSRDWFSFRLTKQLLLNVAVDVGQTEIAASVAVGKAFVIQAKGIQ